MISNNKFIPIDVAKSPPELVMKFLISAIHLMGTHMISDYAKVKSSSEAEFKTTYNKVLAEIDRMSHKIDEKLDLVTVGDDTNLGVMVLSILEIAVMAMSAYIDTAGEADVQAAVEDDEDSVLDELIEDADQDFEVPSGFLMRGKTKGDH